MFTKKNCYSTEVSLSYHFNKIKLLFRTLIRYRKSKPRVPRPTAVPRGPGPVVVPDQYSPHGSIENGCDSSPTSTNSPTSVVNGSARSSPHYSSGTV